MKKLTWKLGSFLSTHNSSAYQLEIKMRYLVAHEAEQEKQEKSTGKPGTDDLEPRPQIPFSPNTIYNWVKTSSVPERIQTATFERILRALESIVGREVELSEILTWEDHSDAVVEGSAHIRSKPQSTKSLKPKAKT
jgi:hypothetical protein